MDRLQRQGLIERRECPDDARGSLAALTDAGAERLAEARPTHLDGVRRLYLEPLGADERRRLATAWERIADAGGP